MERRQAEPKDGTGYDIRVSNLPPDATKEEITIHFQKRKHGGGDVKSVRLTKDGVAHVTFEREETVESVVNREHSMNGTILEVTRYRPQTRTPVASPPATAVPQPQVFEVLTATVSKELFTPNDPSTRDLMGKMKSEVSVDLRSTMDGFQVKGTFEEIHRARDFLLKSLHRVPEYQVNSKQPETLENPKTEDRSGVVEGSRVLSTGNAKGAVAASTKHSELDSSNSPLGRGDVQGSEVSLHSAADERKYVETHYDSGKYRTGRQDTGVAEKDIAHQQLETIPLPLKFVLHFNRDGLHSIQLAFDVVIEPAKDHSFVRVIPEDDCTPEKLNGACDEFLCYYKGACTGMVEDKITLEFPSGISLDNYPPETIQTGLPVLVQRGEDPNQLVLYGDTASVIAAKERLLLLSDSWEFSGASMVYRSRDEERNSEPHEILRKKTPTGVSLSVWKGDITRMNVKAIVNPANRFLEHVGGLARAIRQAGGEAIQDESNAITRKRGDVQVGSAVSTKAGSLPCEMVIHAVGPDRWTYNNQECQDLLFRACTSSLKIANKAGLESIAFPAISSGLYGVSLTLCAGTMLNAVEKFVQASAARKIVVSDIRFVHINDDAVEVFSEELANRYP